VPPECSETSVSHFKMHQNRFRLGAQRFPDPLAEIGEGEGRDGGDGDEGKGGKGKIGPPRF
jgi:hypothetical protein